MLSPRSTKFAPDTHLRLLVNALSIGSLSGRHVLYGHVEQLAQNVGGAHEILLLHQPGEDVSRMERLPAVRTLKAPAACRRWLVRTAWESLSLPGLMKREKVDAYFTPAGTILPQSPVPQSTLAQNPWCMVPGMATTFAEKWKATVQRRAYRHAFVNADLMVYNSQHMRDLYQNNAPGRSERNHLIVYQGIDEETFASANALQAVHQRRPLSILAVSVMARWKGIDVVVEALRELHRRQIPATFTLVGPWPDAVYRARVEALVDEYQLRPFVTLAGLVEKAKLHEHYAKARVFCLMSRCESFGIPAVEAQAFGTPVVGSSICAMQEICGAGGLCTSPDQPLVVADYLARLLTDADYWQQMSLSAVSNAARFRWAECSRPLMVLFDLAGRNGTAAKRQTLGANVA